MSINKSTDIKDLDYYNSINELLEEDDILELDIHILGWEKKFRVRGLSFGQIEKINKAVTDEDGNIDSELFIYHTLIEGVVRPKMNLTLAKKLADKNGSYVRQLSDEIWNIGRISRKQWDAYIFELERAEKIEKGDFSELVKQKEDEE